jgi:hypothetical protein
VTYLNMLNLMKVLLFCLCCKGSRRFEGTWRLHFHLSSVTLKTKAILYFQTSGSRSRTIQRHVPEGSNCQLHLSDDDVSPTVL